MRSVLMVLKAWEYAAQSCYNICLYVTFTGMWLPQVCDFQKCPTSFHASKFPSQKQALLSGRGTYVTFLNKLIDSYKRSVLGRWPFSYHYNCDDCKTVPKLEESCLPKTHIVPKLIWMKDLRDIEEVMSDPGKHPMRIVDDPWFLDICLHTYLWHTANY